MRHGTLLPRCSRDGGSALIYQSDVSAVAIRRREAFTCRCRTRHMRVRLPGNNLVRRRVPMPAPADRLHRSWLTAAPIAHRGLHDRAGGRPENTLAAFARCCELGFAAE